MLHSLVAWLVRSVFKLIFIAFLAIAVAAIAGRVAAGNTGILKDFVELEGFVLKLGMTFLFAGLAIAYLLISRKALLPNETPQSTPAEPVGHGWLVLMAVALAALPVIAVAQIGPLFSVWDATRELTTHAGFDEQAFGASEGLIVLPIMAGLLVPIGELVLTACFGFCSLALLALFAFHSRLFPRAFLMCMVCQLALLLATRYALDLDIVGRVQKTVEQELSKVPSDDGALLLQWAQRHQAVVRPVGNGLAWTFAGYALWLPALLATDRARKSFTRDPATAASFAFQTLRTLTRIAFEGKTYKSADEMPADVRQRYDAVMGALAAAEHHTKNESLNTLGYKTARNVLQRFMHNGRWYESLDDLPPDAREHLQKLIGPQPQLGPDTEKADS